MSFTGELREEQRLAAQELAKYDTGVLAAGTAFGKTVLAAWMIAARNVSTLVLVNKRQLQSQWVERLSESRTPYRLSLESAQCGNVNLRLADRYKRALGMSRC